MDDRAVRDGAVPVALLAPGRLRPVGVRRLADDDPRAARAGGRRRGVPRARRSATRCRRARRRRARAIAAWYPGATAEQRDDGERRLRGEPPGALGAAEPGTGSRSWCRTTCQGWGLGSFFGTRSDTFELARRDGRMGARPRQSLERAVTKRTKAVMVCNPNNPTGAVLTEAEMDEIVRAAERVGAWIVADEIYRGAEVDTDDTTPTFWGRYEQGRSSRAGCRRRSRCRASGWGGPSRRRR